MSADNIAAARRWFEDVWNRKDAAVIAERMPAHCVAHSDAGSVVGPEAFAALHAQFCAQMPDIRFTIEAAIGEGDLVALRWHAVAGLGPDGAPTDATIPIRGCTWQRYEDGVVVEGWDFYDLGGLRARLAGASA